MVRCDHRRAVENEPRRLRDLRGTCVRPCSRSKREEHGGRYGPLVRSAACCTGAPCNPDSDLWGTQVSTSTISVRLRLNDPCPRCSELLLARPMRSIFALFGKREFLRCPRCNFGLMSSELRNDDKDFSKPIWSSMTQETKRSALTRTEQRAAEIDVWVKDHLTTTRTAHEEKISKQRALRLARDAELSKEKHDDR